MSRIKVGGNWRGPGNIWVKVSGAWRESFEAFLRVSGTWRKFLFIVPNVIGQTRTNANAAITARGLTVGTQTAVVINNNQQLNQQVIDTNPVAGSSLEPNGAVNYRYYQFVAPPYFPPFFPPYFPPYFPPFFPPPFFPPPPPFFPPPPPKFDKSIGVDTLVRTPDGLVPAGDLVVGDELISAKIEGFPHMWTEEMWDIIENWNPENPEIEVVTTTIWQMRRYVSDWAIIINYDIFSETHYILIKRDGRAEFVDVLDVLETDLVYSYEHRDWTEIFLLEKIEAPHEVVCINTEPYDVFFTENMLVHDSHDPKIGGELDASDFNL
jgi:hypothetical protein